MPASHVKHAPESSEVVGGEHAIGLQTRVSRHGTVKDCSCRRIARAVVPVAHAVDAAEGVFAGAYAIEQAPPRLPEPRLANIGRPRTDRFARVGPQTLAERGQREMTIRVL